MAAEMVNFTKLRSCSRPARACSRRPTRRRRASCRCSAARHRVPFGARAASGPPVVVKVAGPRGRCDRACRPSIRPVVAVVPIAVRDAGGRSTRSRTAWSRSGAPPGLPTIVAGGRTRRAGAARPGRAGRLRRARRASSCAAPAASPAAGERRPARRARRRRGRRDRRPGRRPRRSGVARPAAGRTDTQRRPAAIVGGALSVPRTASLAARGACTLPAAARVRCRACATAPADLPAALEPARVPRRLRAAP